MLPVPGPGFRDWFWTGFGRKSSSNELTTGAKLPGPWAWAKGDRFLVRSHEACAKAGPKAAPEARSGDRKHECVTQGSCFQLFCLRLPHAPSSGARGRDHGRTAMPSGP